MLNCTLRTIAAPYNRHSPPSHTPGKKYGPICSWITGWFNLLGNVASTAGVAFASAQLMANYILLSTGTAADLNEDGIAPDGYLAPQVRAGWADEPEASAPLLGIRALAAPQPALTAPDAPLSGWRARAVWRPPSRAAADLAPTSCSRCCWPCTPACYCFRAW